MGQTHVNSVSDSDYFPFLIASWQ